MRFSLLRQVFFAFNFGDVYSCSLSADLGLIAQVQVALVELRFKTLWHASILTSSLSPLISSMSTLLKLAAPESVHGFSLISFSFISNSPKIVDNDGQAGVRRQSIANDRSGRRVSLLWIHVLLRTKGRTSSSPNVSLAFTATW